MRVDDELEVVTDTEGHRVCFTLQLSIDELEELQEVLRGLQEEDHHRSAGELLGIVSRVRDWFRPYLELEEAALEHVNPDQEIEDV